MQSSWENVKRWENSPNVTDTKWADAAGNWHQQTWWIWGGGEMQYLWSTVKWGRLGFCYPLTDLFQTPRWISRHGKTVFFFFLFVTQKEYWGFPGGSAVKSPPANAGNTGSGRSAGEGNGNPLQYSCLQNPMDRGAWQATVHGVAESWTQLSDNDKKNTTRKWEWGELDPVLWKSLVLASWFEMQT